MSTGRPTRDLGEKGKTWTTRKDNGSWTAGAWVRGRDGRSKQVTVSAPTKGAAQRKLERKIDALVEPSATGVQPSWTIEATATHWLEHKARYGKTRGNRPLARQSLGNYEAHIRQVIVPSLGQMRLRELTTPGLETSLARLDDTGISTLGARGLLSQILDLAVRDGALHHNPMRLVAAPPRDVPEVEALDVAAARRLLEVVHPDHLRKPGKRGPNIDLHDLCVLGLATGARIGELTALTWSAYQQRDGSPTLLIDATLVEPRKGWVEGLQRQPATKTGSTRRLVLPDAAAEAIERRRRCSQFVEPHDPILCSARGTFLWPNNLRTRLRAALADDDELRGTTPHTLRRTVGTLIAYEVGLEAARMQLGHTLTGSTTLSRYVAHRQDAPDLRSTLDQFFG